MIKNYLTLFFFLILIPSLFAQSDQSESLTITTYYPAPYGVYRDLIARKSLAVGDFTANEVQALKRGQFSVGNSIIYKPLAGDPATWAKTGPEGEMAYSSLKKNMYFFNGATWSPIGSVVTPTPTPTSTPPPTSPPAPPPVDPPGTIKGAVTITFYKNGGDACGRETCSNTAPGICVESGYPCPGQGVFYTAGCDAGWHYISTGVGGDMWMTTINYYSCQKN